jgi:hypothetical protein
MPMESAFQLENMPMYGKCFSVGYVENFPIPQTIFQTEKAEVQICGNELLSVVENLTN